PKRRNTPETSEIAFLGVPYPHHLLNAKSAPLKTPARAFLALLPCVSSPSKATRFAGVPFGKEVAGRLLCNSAQGYLIQCAVSCQIPPPLGAAFSLIRFDHVQELVPAP